jgi:hypothetical protein
LFFQIFTNQFPNKSQNQSSNHKHSCSQFGFWNLNIGTYLEIGLWKFPSLRPLITLTPPIPSTAPSSAPRKKQIPSSEMKTVTIALLAVLPTIALAADSKKVDSLAEVSPKTPALLCADQSDNRIRLINPFSAGDRKPTVWSCPDAEAKWRGVGHDLFPLRKEAKLLVSKHALFLFDIATEKFEVVAELAGRSS